MKQIIIDGRIGKEDAKLMTAKNGKPYIRFSLANNSFVNGANKTEWFDVTSFDQYTVENRLKLLTKGRYVIVNGILNSEVSANGGKIYLNQYVRANDIEVPSFGTKKEDSTDGQISTYTGGTKSDLTTGHVESKPEVKPEEKPAPQVSVASSSQAAGWSNDDDLPF